MKVLVTGALGQLGSDVMAAGHLKNWDMVGTSVDGKKYVKLDITKKEEVVDVMNRIRPNVVVHCAAYTNVDQAEVEVEICEKINVLGTKNLVQAAEKTNATLLYISTDYVFNGAGDTPFDENSEPNPLSVYGKTKLAGEQIVQQELEKWFILRVSWLFGHNGPNFVETMLRLGKEKRELNIVGDQIGSPTYTKHLATFILDLINTNHYGVYHVTNEGYCSWATFAKTIFRHAKQNVYVNEIASHEYPTLAKRPHNSRLGKNKIKEIGLQPLPMWEEALEEYINFTK